MNRPRTSTISSTIRRTVRRHVISLRKKTVHKTITGQRKRPDHLRAATVAFRRSISRHRKLMKLAPEAFDFGICDKIDRDNLEKERAWLEWEPVLRKVYGLDPETAPGENPGRCKWGAERVQEYMLSLPKRVQQKAEETWLEWEAWMKAGSEALAKYELERPRKPPRLRTIAGLLDVGITMKRLAVGAETRLKVDPLAHLYQRDVQADLEKIYGKPEDDLPP